MMAIYVIFMLNIIHFGEECDVFGRERERSLSIPKKISFLKMNRKLIIKYPDFPVWFKFRVHSRAKNMNFLSDWLIKS